MEQTTVESDDLKWHRATAAGFAILFVMLGIWSAVTTWTKSIGADFVSFWAAGRLALAGRAVDAYNIALHHQVEEMVAPHVGLIPFPYPPPFLILVAPFALVGFGLAFTFWSAITAGFYAFASSRVAPLRFAFSIAPAGVNFMIAQSGFLMGGLFILGLSLVASTPFAAGAVLGLLILKPQIALLLPVAMLAGREWRVIGGAIASSSAALLLGLMIFGWQAYEAFWNILPHYVGFMRDSRLPWYQIASPFGLARFSGIPQPAALSIHILIAALATALTARAWWLKLDERIPILAASTMLISPYFFTYDSLLIIVPLGWLLRHNVRPLILASIWGLSLFPMVTSLSPFFVPNTMSLAAIGCLYMLHSQASGRRATSSAPIGSEALARQ